MGWLGTYAQRYELTVDSTKINSNLTNFPVVVHFGTASGPSDIDNTYVFEAVGSDFTSVVFTDSDGETKLYAEIIRWDASALSGSARVTLPSVSSVSDTTFYMYFDPNETESTYITSNIDGSITGNPPDVYASCGFIDVWNMQNEPGGGNTLKDSSYGGLDGDLSLLPSTALTDGPDGLSSISFGGSAGINVGGSSLGSAIWTFSGYINPDVVQNMRIFGRHDVYPYYGMYIGLETTRQAIEVLVSWNGTGYYGLYSDNDSIAAEQWQHVALSYDGSFVRLFIDGVEHVGGNFPFAYSLGIYVNTGQETRIGSTQAFDAPFVGDISFVSMSNRIQSDAWIYAEYAGLSDDLVGLSKTESLVGIQAGQTRYRCVLTGAADGVGNVTLPISSFQHSQGTGQRSRVSCVVPGTDYYDDIADRSNGTIRIYQDIYRDDSLVFSSLLGSALIDDIRTDQGAKNSSVTLQGYGPLSPTYSEYTLSGHNYRSLSQGLLSFRFQKPDGRVRPGDTLHIETDGVTDTITVGSVSIYVSVTSGGSISSSMEIREATA